MSENTPDWEVASASEIRRRDRETKAKIDEWRAARKKAEDLHKEIDDVFSLHTNLHVKCGDSTNDAWLNCVAEHYISLGDFLARFKETILDFRRFTAPEVTFFALIVPLLKNDLPAFQKEIKEQSQAELPNGNGTQLHSTLQHLLEFKRWLKGRVAPLPDPPIGGDQAPVNLGNDLGTGRINAGDASANGDGGSITTEAALITAALNLLDKHPDLSTGQLARELGCTEGVLAGSTKFQHLAQMLRFEKTLTSNQGEAIIAMANRQYGISSLAPVTVTENENNVLQVFVKQSSVDEKALIDKSGVPHAPKVLSRLRKKYDARFASAIKMPGKKHSGGYRVNIRSA